MKTIAVTQLRPGNIAHFHGARFEIIRTGESRGHIEGGAAYGAHAEFVGPSPVAVPVGRWLDGEIVPGYFGPDKDWSFQGNACAGASIEASA